VLASHAGGVQVVAQCGANSADFVSRKLFALTAATHHNAEVGFAIAHCATDPSANRRVIATFAGVSALIVDGMSGSGQKRHEMLFEIKPSVI
jgi:hypothetical protein